MIKNKIKMYNFFITISITLLLMISVSSCTNTNELEEYNQNLENNIQEGIIQEGISEEIDLPKLCEKLNGKWLSDYYECEGISQKECEYLDGTYEECASACRHSSGKEMCTVNCVQVCSFA